MVRYVTCGAVLHTVLWQPAVAAVLNIRRCMVMFQGGMFSTLRVSPKTEVGIQLEVF
jgi:hypothetical protein